jgi:hypothetical protein
MLRITTWRITGTPPQDMTPQTAFQAISDMCTTLSTLPGAGGVHWYFGGGGIVTVGMPENYAVADSILKSQAAQGAVAKVLGLGYSIVDDQFLLEPGQVLPFAQAAQATPAAVRN